MPDQDTSARNWKAQGFTAEHVAQMATELGWSPIETIKALKKHFDVGIGDGKMLVDRTLDKPTRQANEYLRLQFEFVANLPHWVTEDDLEALEEDSGWNLKLFALVAAGRHDDAVAAIKRFEPSEMRFRPLAEADAAQLVRDEIATWGHPMQLLEEHTREHSFGWSFSCQSVAYVESGDFRDMVVGHGPFIVDRWTAVLWSTGPAFLLEDCVQNYLATGDPTVAPTARTAS